MAYNVFKRPMFKRGGSATGTGIMSHVEPRVKAQAGGYQFFNTPAGKGLEGMAAYGPNAALAGLIDLGAVPLNTVGRMFGYNPGFSGTKAVDALTGGQFSRFTGYDPNVARFLGVPTSAKQGFAEGVMTTPKDDYEVSGGVAQVKPGETALDAVINRAMEKKQKPDAPGSSEPKDPKYKESDTRSRVESEADDIMNILRDKDLDRAEMFLLASKALKTPGSISDKIDVAVTDAAKIAREKAKDRKAAKLMAYKSVKEEDIAKIKAGELPGAGKIAKRVAFLQSKDKLTKEEQNELAGLKTFIDQETYGEKLKKKAYTDIFVAGREQIPAMERQLSALNKKKSLTEDEQIRKSELEKKLRELYYYREQAGFPSFAEGGRVNYQEGSPDPMSDLEVSEMSGDDNKFPTKPVEKLSFQQLRERLPQEITNDIVQLISNSEEALQDFAYIRTQQDINDFNVKYGVNLVLPPAKG